MFERLRLWLFGPIECRHIEPPEPWPWPGFVSPYVVDPTTLLDGGHKRKERMKTSRFEIFCDKAGAYRWRLKAANNKVVAQSEGYTREIDAKRSCKAVQTAANGATFVE